MTSSGLMGKMGYPSYTPALSSTCSPWQVLAPTPHLSAWPSPFPQSLSPLPSEPPTQPRKLPASCTAQEYFGIWAVSCDASMGHSGVLVKCLLAMNTCELRDSRRGSMQKVPKPFHPPLNAWLCFLFQSPGLELSMWLEKICMSLVLTLQYWFLLIVTESHGEVEICLHLNCSHCLLKDCQWQTELHLAK